MKTYRVVVLNAAMPILVGDNGIYPIMNNIWGHGEEVDEDDIVFENVNETKCVFPNQKI